MNPRSRLRRPPFRPAGQVGRCRPGRAGLAALLAAGLVAGACSDSDEKPTQAAEPSTSSTTTTAPETTTSSEAPTTTTVLPPPTTTGPAVTVPTAPPAAPTGPTGTLAWKACGGLQCATLVVPLDYANPGGPTIDLALARRPARAPARRIGSLLFNPGGPGNSGVDGLPGELKVLTAGLQDRFDVVSWDPRGVERSAPVHCRDPKQGTSSGGGGDTGPPVDPAPREQEQQQALIEGYRAFGQACAQWSGAVLGYVGVDNTAEDLDRIRIALGEERLTFIGHSAGTHIGAIYADKFPTRVRAMVLDGPVDPSLDLHGKTMGQARAYEGVFAAFATWCAGTSSCAWRPAGGPSRDAMVALLDRVRQTPLTAPKGEQIGPGEINNGMMGRLNARSRWASLGDALAAAERGDGTPFATLSSNYVNGGSSNAADARLAILCASHPALRDGNGYPALADAARAEAPIFGPVLTWAELPCGVWPTAATQPARPVRAAGAPPILVVATTGDPATPQVWGEALANQLEQGVLVLRQGQEHVAYYYSSCVRRLVDAYILDGKAPADPTTCTS